jgi:hypothetical protein
MAVLVVPSQTPTTELLLEALSSPITDAYDFWLSRLPQKNWRQQNVNIGNGWSPRIPGLLPSLPLLPVFFESQEHVYVSNRAKA